MCLPIFVRNLIVIFLGLPVLLSCGVRGDPIPPGVRMEIGRGRPVYTNPDHRMPSVPLKSIDEIEEGKIEDDEK